jgi:hypothetical protein
MQVNFLNEKSKKVLSGELCLRSRNAPTQGLEDEELEEVFGEFVEVASNSEEAKKK